MIEPSFFERDPVTCAMELVGVTLSRGACAGVIIETEAYAESGDEACHLFTRPSARKFAASHPAGTAYVYLNYGVHWLANVLCHDAATGDSGFVLLRALDPVRGVDEMKRRRRREMERELCSGPGKLTAALGIGPETHGNSLCGGSEIFLEIGSPTKHEIVEDRRIGISAAQDLQRRFLSKNHPGVSVPAGRAR